MKKTDEKVEMPPEGTWFPVDPDKLTIHCGSCGVAHKVQIRFTESELLVGGRQIIEMRITRSK